MDALRTATEAHKRYAETRNKLAIEFLYTDEAEHQREIERLWENRRKRLAKKKNCGIASQFFFLQVM